MTSGVVQASKLHRVSLEISTESVLLGMKLAIQTTFIAFFLKKMHPKRKIKWFWWNRFIWSTPQAKSFEWLSSLECLIEPDEHVLVKTFYKLSQKHFKFHKRSLVSSN